MLTSSNKYKLTKEMHDLLFSWLRNSKFRSEHLNTADTILIMSYLDEGHYDEYGKGFLNSIREKWISFNS